MAKYMVIEPSRARNMQYLLDLEYFVHILTNYTTYFKARMLVEICNRMTNEKQCLITLDIMQ